MPAITVAPITVTVPIAATGIEHADARANDDRRAAAAVMTASMATAADNDGNTGIRRRGCG
jgi:hypothetical protein